MEIRKNVGNALQSLLLPEVIEEMIMGYVLSNIESNDIYNWYDVKRQGSDGLMVRYAYKSKVNIFLNLYIPIKTPRFKVRVLRRFILKYNTVSRELQFVDRSVFLFDNGTITFNKNTVRVNIKDILKILNIYNNPNFKRIIIGGHCLM